ncbi:hypothetical protein ABEY43_06255 [Priestia megaterium]
MSSKTQLYDNGKWKTIDHAELKRRDKFRMFNNGKKVRGNKGQIVFTAKSDAYYNEESKKVLVDIL